MFDAYKYLGIDIIGITETKMSEKKSKNILNNKKIYKSWQTGTTEDRKTGGVGIAVKIGLNIQTYSQRYQKTGTSYFYRFNF